MQTKKTMVLLVDNDDGISVRLEGVIEDVGYLVCGVEDGYQDIELVKQIDFHWVFMDIRMPGLNGVETYLEIKKISPSSKVVMMTGFSNGELVKNALDEGVHSLIHKPFKVSRIIDTLRGVLKTETVLVAAHRG